MPSALTLQFERAVNEFEWWQAVRPDERSDAPSWWWSTAIEASNEKAAMPSEWCAVLGVAREATYAEGAKVFMKALAGQKHLPWPDEFPQKFKAESA